MCLFGELLRDVQRFGGIPWLLIFPVVFGVSLALIIQAIERIGLKCLTLRL